MVVEAPARGLVDLHAIASDRSFVRIRGVKETSFGPGEGPTTSVSVSVHEGTISAVRARVGKRGVSPYIEAAIQRQIERDNLAELVADYEARHGVITEAEVRAAEEKLLGPTDRGTNDTQHVG